MACPPWSWEKREPEGIPDPLARDNINQFIVKGTDWKQIVQDKTQFELGEIIFTYIGSYNTRYTDKSYGTFPNIDGSTVLLPMGAEFVWQFLDLTMGKNIDSERYGYSESEKTLDFLDFSTTSGAYNKLINDITKKSKVSFFNTDDFGWEYYYFNKRPDIVLATYPSTNIRT